MCDEWEDVKGTRKIGLQRFEDILSDLWIEKANMQLPGGHDIRKEAVSLLTQARNTTTASYKNSIGENAHLALTTEP